MSVDGGQAASGPYDTFAPKYIERGLPPLPIEPGKKWPACWNGQSYTLLAGWTTKPPITTPQPGAGIGLRLGVAIGLDYVLVGLDLDDEEVAIRLLGIAPATPVRKVGQRGETWIYKAKPGAITTKRYRLGDKTIAELLSAGTQTVLPPSIHPTGQPYRWLGKSLLDVNIDELPELTPDAVSNIETALRSVGWEPEPQKPAPPPLPPDANDIDGNDDGDAFERAKTAAMRNLPAWVPHLGLQKCRRRRGPHASYEAVPEFRPSSAGRPLEQRGYNLKISPKGICDFGDGEKGYSAIDLVMAARGCTVSQALTWLEERLGLGTDGPEIDYDALVGTSENPKPNPGADAKTSDDGPKGDQQHESPKQEQSKGKKPRIKLQRYDAPDPTKIPRREWLYGSHYMRKIVTATVGPGGIGKSSLGLVEAVGMAIGRDLLDGGKLPRPLRVWYHNGEDPRDELNRRIGAICIFYKVDAQEVSKNMFTTCGLDMPIKVAAGSMEVKLDKALVAEITATIREHEIDVAIFDPLVTLHNTSEIFTATMDPVIREVFGTIANDTNTAVELAHHTRKKATGQDEYTAADARGSSGIVDAVRGMRVTNQMSKDEAKNFAIDERERDLYFRVSKGKANMTRKGRGKWYQFNSVILPNGDPERDIPGDDIGVLSTWEPPDMEIKITDDDRNYFHTLVRGEPTYRENKLAKNWIGIPIAHRFGLNLDNKVDKRRAEDTFMTLIKEGVLAVAEGEDGKGYKKNFVVPGVFSPANLGL
jgi:AAA domain/Bifunctional DNA primase/polymerase, N-terminal